MRKLVLLVSVGVLLSGCTAAWSPFYAAFNEPAEAPVVAVAVTGDAAHGEMIYKQGENGSPPCLSCHTLEAGAYSLGPSLHGLIGRAGDRVEGLSANDYIRQSILAPNDYLVNGYRGMMYPKYSDHFDDEDMADLLAYLESL